ncbi:unnamed protein product [Trichobilharzia szidati]|nr:unnamed protein product [Trichobilharzia szidati]
MYSCSPPTSKKIKINRMKYNSQAIYLFLTNILRERNHRMIKVSIILLLLLNCELVIPQDVAGGENIDTTTDTTSTTYSELVSSTELISTTNVPETSVEQTSGEQTTNETDGTATDSSTDETRNTDSSTNQVEMGIIVLIIFVGILTLTAVASIIYHVLRKDKSENVTVIRIL